jgi:hypothetical protein
MEPADVAPLSGAARPILYIIALLKRIPDHQTHIRRVKALVE